VAKKPDTPCVDCGKLTWTGPRSLPADERRCRDCRKPTTEPRPARQAPPLALDLASVVRSGDRKRSLEALRDALADQMAVAEPREAAALSRELRATLADLAALSEDGPKESILDELARQRTKRQQEATG
jgi:hypothetical protein